MSSEHNDALSAEDIVRAFFNAWETDGFVPAFEKYMHPKGVWQNSGFPDAIGKAAVMELLNTYMGFSGLPYGRVELKNIVSKNNTVLTERVDHLFDGKGKTHSAPIAGTLVVEDGLIKRYADYFDTRQFVEMGAPI